MIVTWEHQSTLRQSTVRYSGGGQLIFLIRKPRTISRTVSDNETGGPYLTSIHNS